MFDNLKKSNDIEEAKDSLGGNAALESGLVDLTVDIAYLTIASSGAMALNVNFNTPSGGKYREQLWMTSGTAKGSKNYFEKDGQKHYLPGFLSADALCLLTVGKSIGELTPEDKIVPIWNADAKKELPTAVKVYTDLIGKTIIAGVIKEMVDVNKDTGTVDAAGKKIYAPTGESRAQNVIDKFFRSKDGMTVTEISAQETTAAFKDAWAAKFTGLVRDKTNKKAGAAGKTTGAPVAAKPAKSLFED